MCGSQRKVRGFITRIQLVHSGRVFYFYEVKIFVPMPVLNDRFFTALLACERGFYGRFMI